MRRGEKDKSRKELRFDVAQVSHDCNADGDRRDVVPDSAFTVFRARVNAHLARAPTAVIAFSYIFSSFSFYFYFFFSFSKTFNLSHSLSLSNDSVTQLPVAHSHGLASSSIQIQFLFLFFFNRTIYMIIPQI